MSVDEQATVTRTPGEDVWPFHVNGKVFHVNGHTSGFPLTEDELRNLRDHADLLLQDKAPQLLVTPGQVYVDEGILDALLDSKSTTTMDYAVKAYLKERGVVFT